VESTENEEFLDPKRKDSQEVTGQDWEQVLPRRAAEGMGGQATPSVRWMIGHRLHPDPFL